MANVVNLIADGLHLLRGFQHDHIELSFTNSASQPFGRCDDREPANSRAENGTTDDRLALTRCQQRDFDAREIVSGLLRRLVYIRRSAVIANLAHDVPLSI